MEVDSLVLKAEIVFTQSLFGKNLCTSNLMVDAFNDLVHKPGQPKDTTGNASVHTLTYKDPLQKIAPTISKH